MSFPNVSDIVATTIESRSGEIADNVTKNNAVLAKLKASGKVRSVTGGSVIYEELSFAQKGNVGWYSGYDLLSVAAQDVLSAAQFSLKQLACPVVVSGLELLENSGKEQIIDLLESRVRVAEATMANTLAQGVYSDGTGSGGKQLVGLQAAVSATPTTGTYGGIDRATWTFWRNYYLASTTTSSNIQSAMNTVYSNLCRGKDHPDLILTDNNGWQQFSASLQTLQRFTDSKMADLGFASLKYMGADFVLDGGIGGYCPTSYMYFLNTDYLFLRPHKDRNMVSLDPQKRAPVNQDAEIQILAWAGALTCSGAQFQGLLNFA
jgi:hypothetical protein